ncbi:MAG: hypothetical protein ACRDJE_11150 [Dehalococcoidia bacterium]
MTQMTEAQQQQVGAVAERVAIKLRAFCEGLPADERAVLAATLAHNRGGPDGQADDGAAYAARAVAEAFAAGDDVSGHAVMIGGLWFSEPGSEQRHPIPPTRVGVDGPSFNPPRLPREPRDV